jgi:phosphatidylglycerol:prolipoprotein diacylglycerol transferase
MRLNLFHIPVMFGPLPVFGFGWLLIAWLLVGGFLLWRGRNHGVSRAETGSLATSLFVGGLVIALLMPRLAEAQGLPVRGYGVMLVCAIGAAVGLATRRARNVGLDPEYVSALGFALIVSGIVGARLFYIVQHWSQFQKPTLPETLRAMLSFNEGGLVVYGSLLAGGAALVYFLWRYKLPGLALADLVAPSVILGMAIGRIGCFLTGCCFGSPSDLPWAVTFPPGSPPHLDQINRGLLALEGLKFDLPTDAGIEITSVEAGCPAAKQGLKVGDRITAARIALAAADSAAHEVPLYELTDTLAHLGPGDAITLSVASRLAPVTWRLAETPSRSLPVHPAQLYSFLDAMLLFFFLLAYEPFRRRDGEILAWLLTIHPISRFLLEMLRSDEAPVWGTPFHISQNISVILFAGGLALWGYLWTRPPGLASFAKIGPMPTRHTARAQ